MASECGADGDIRIIFGQERADGIGNEILVLVCPSSRIFVLTASELWESRTLNHIQANLRQASLDAVIHAGISGEPDVKRIDAFSR